MCKKAIKAIKSIVHETFINKINILQFSQYSDPGLLLCVCFVVVMDDQGWLRSAKSCKGYSWRVKGSQKVSKGVKRVEKGWPRVTNGSRGCKRLFLMNCVLKLYKL